MRMLPFYVRLCSVGLLLWAGCQASELTADSPANKVLPAATAQTPTTPETALFEAEAPLNYVNKVKGLLTGLAATDAEVSTVAADPDALRGLVDGWLQLPQYQNVLLDLFGQFFQQKNITQNELATLDQQVSGGGGVSDLSIVNYVRESFPRTMVALVNQGTPFTAALTTNQFMMNVPLMVYYGVIEAIQENDRGYSTDLMVTQHANDVFIRYVYGTSPIDLGLSSDPTNPNYLTFATTFPTSAANSNCLTNGIFLITPRNAVTGVTFTENLFHAIAGFDIFSYYMNAYCPGPAPPSRWLDSDLAWRMVTVRTPNANEATTNFWDVKTMRSVPTLVQKTPRVGFYTTPAFLGQWNTNVSNQARSTINQSLIVALGRAFDGSDRTMPKSLAALPTAHADPSSACYGCHLTMDPMRQYFRQQYSLSFDLQDDPNQMAMPGQFAQGGVSAVGTGIADLGQQLALQPDFPLAWAKRLCEWATSSTCDQTDPELVRIGNVFEASDFNWNTLVGEMMSSPLVTYAKATSSSVSHGVSLSIARREQLCRKLSSRLNIEDICQLKMGTVVSPSLVPVAYIAQALPSDDYARGATKAVHVTDPSFVYRVGLENICTFVSQQVVDGGPTSPYQSSQAEAAISQMAANLLGLSGDSRAAVESVLEQHQAAAIASGASLTDALRSTFIVACTSPIFAAMGL